MKYVFLLVVVCVYITAIKTFLLEDTLRRLFKGNGSETKKESPPNKNVEIVNKPYARSLKSLNNELRYDLEATGNKNLDKNEKNRYVGRTPHPKTRRQFGVDEWNQILDTLRMEKKPKTKTRQRMPYNLENIRRSLQGKKREHKKLMKINEHGEVKHGDAKMRTGGVDFDDGDDDDDSSKSSDQDLGDIEDWKEEWRHEWLGMQFEATQPNMTTPKGDFVNMAAARPWGVPCGDPMQHDMPWGTCLLPMECEAEYRIYRGDSTCGKTQFVCCALQLNLYDMYQGFDLSFADTSMETDIDQLKNENSKDSSERRKRKERREKKRRERERKRRKHRMKKLIQRIVNRLKRILAKMYRNTTKDRQLKTKTLKSYVKMLKKKYKQDRKNVKTLHDYRLNEIDNVLKAKLQVILSMNKEFATNDTFRDIITKGTMSKKAARMLSVMYPDLEPSLRSYTRRSGVNLKDGGEESSYDVEYGFLYY